VTEQWTELERLANAVANDRDWTVEQSGLPEYRNVSFYVEAGEDLLLSTNGDRPELAAFVAAANPAIIKRLIAENRAMREGLERARSDIESWFECISAEDRSEPAMLLALEDDVSNISRILKDPTA
jgi:hypothetical protein